MGATARAVDLTDVKEGSNFRPKRKPSGDYKAKIVKADDHIKEGKTPGWVLTIQVEGDARATYPIYLNPDKKQAWKIWQVCRAAGLNVKQARVRFDPNRLVGKSIGVALEDDEYEGRLKSTIDETFPVSEVGANADEGIDIDEDDEVEVPDDEPEDEVEEEEEPPPPPKKRTVRRKPAPEPEPEDDEEEEEPEAAPRRRRPAAKAAPAATTRRKKAAPVVEDEDEDLDDLDLDDLDE